MNKKLWQQKMYFSDILSEGFHLARINISPITRLIVFINIPLNLLRTFLYNSSFYETPTGKMLLKFLVDGVSTLLGLITVVGISYIVEKSFREDAFSFNDVLQFSLSKLGAVFWTSILLSAITLGLTILLIVPGIIWSNYYSFAISIVALRNMRGKAALDYSKKLITGQWWRVFGVYFGITFLVLCVNVPISLITRKAPGVLLNSFIPLTIFDFVGAIAIIMSVILFLNIEYARDFQKEKLRSK